MQLHPFTVPAFGDTQLLCRPGRLVPALSGLAISSMLVVPMLAIAWKGGPWLLGIILGLMALFLIPLLIGDLRARCRPTSWLMCIRPEALWINLRSYQEQSTDSEAAVVELNYAEIAEVYKYQESYSTPNDKGGNRRTKVTSLDIRLNHEQTAELQQALSIWRRHEQPERVYFGNIRVRNVVNSVPVSLPAANVVRLAWRGSSHWIAPSMGRTLNVLASSVKVAAPSRRDRPSWRNLSEVELDDQILELARSGKSMDAIRLLTKRRGYSLTNAKQFVNELTEQA